MGESTLGVGIIGVSPVWGWAAVAHIPALQALPNYEIRAISGRSDDSVRAAGEAFGIKTVFSDHDELVVQPTIDVVAVTVKVPHHRELVSAALAAGKAVYCEWPLGRDLDDVRRPARPGLPVRSPDGSRRSSRPSHPRGHRGSGGRSEACSASQRQAF